MIRVSIRLPVFWIVLLAVPGSALACPPAPDIITAETLKVVSLNVAHGRGLGWNQMFQKEATTRSNLSRVAVLLEDLAADVVALQEADAPSRWSGGFDHVALLAGQAGYPCVAHGRHANARLYSFGTALLSRHGFDSTLTHDFEPSWPTTTKGFTLGTLLWNPGSALPEPIQIHLMSVHLDFSRKSVRDAQIAEMQSALADFERPFVIMGDFNSDWDTDNSALRQIAEEGSLLAFEPYSENQGTYKKGRKRLDWILISDELSFHTHLVSAVDVSDHRAVIAELRLQKKY